MLTLEHQKSNLGKLREPLTLNWLDGGLPQLVEGFDGSRQQGRADDYRAIALLNGYRDVFNSKGFAMEQLTPATVWNNLDTIYGFNGNNERSLLADGIEQAEAVMLALTTREPIDREALAMELASALFKMERVKDCLNAVVQTLGEAELQ